MIIVPDQNIENLSDYSEYSLTMIKNIAYGDNIDDDYLKIFLGSSAPAEIHWEYLRRQSQFT